MPYIGTQIEAGNYRKLTNLASGFNGVTTTFILSVPPGTSQYYVTPTSTYQLLISVGGIIQQPDTDYTISTNTITFTTAPTAGLSFFGILMGDALNVGTPSDGTVTTAKLANSAVSSDKLADSSVIQSKIGTNVLTPTVSAINNGPLAGFRNAIINGNFDIWQRGTSFTATGYGADRWRTNNAGSTFVTSRQAFTLGQGDVPGQPTYFSRTIVTSVANASNYVQLVQLIEDVRTFANQQITVSFWAKADASKPISVEMGQRFGSGGSPSSDVYFGITKTTIGTSWQKITVTTTCPSVSGKTIGSDNNSSLGVAIWFDAGSTYNSRTDTLGQQSGTFDIAQVQIEPGPVATPFERRPIGTELALCQRYFQKSFPVDTAPAQNIGGTGAVYSQSHAANAPASVQIIFPVQMRTTPSTFTTYNTSAANGNWRNLTASSDITSALQSSSATGAFITSNTQVMAQYAVAAIHWSATSEL